MYLSDRDYQAAISRGDLEITPAPTSDQVQPASIDLRLGTDFIRYHVAKDAIDPEKGIDPACVQRYTDMSLFRLEAGEFALATTVERVKVPSYMLARVEGRSSLGRLGLAVHITAGFIDPGFDGQITLELYNHQCNPLVLRPGMRICQIVFAHLHSPTLNPYSGKYQGQTGTQISRIEQDYPGE